MTFEYEELLQNPDVSSFASFSHVDEDGRLAVKQPTAIEAGSHLLFRHALHKLHRDVLRVINWKVYVTNAVRRFLIFISAYRFLRKLDREDELDINLFFTWEKRTRHNNALFSLLPPLDILMVWHAYLMSPTSFYDFCARNQVLDFALTSFPLIEVVSAIDKSTFEFKPSLTQYAGFQALMRDYGANLEYDVVSIESEVDVYCPLCSNVIASSVPYTNAEHTGFADPGFVAPSMQNKGCDVCSKRPTITHDELRRRQLQADIYSDAILPNCYKYFSSIVTSTLYTPNKIEMVSRKVKDLVKETTETLESSTSISNLISRLIANQREVRFVQWISYILRSYAQLNPIHLLVSSQHRCHLSEDVVGMVIRQQRYTEEAVELDWLHSTQFKDMLQRAEDKYKKFIELYATTRHRMLVPTIEVDLLWMTHLLSMYNYFAYCRGSKSDCVIDYYDKIEESRLFNCFYETQLMYFKTYKEHLTDCPCCKTTTKSKGLTTKNIFRRSKKVGHGVVTVADGRTTVSHVSTHSAIRLPSAAAEKAKLQLPPQAKTRRIESEMGGDWVISIYDPFSGPELKFRTGGVNNLVITEGDGGRLREGIPGVLSDELRPIFFGGSMGALATQQRT